MAEMPPAIQQAVQPAPETASPERQAQRPAAGMSAMDALRQAVREAERFSYSEREPTLNWQSPAETERTKAANCVDAAVWAIHRTSQLRKDPTDLRLVLGPLNGRPHAWVEMRDGDQTTWADPTPPNKDMIERPGFFTRRKPVYSFRFNGQGPTGFYGGAPYTQEAK